MGFDRVAILHCNARLKSDDPGKQEHAIQKHAYVVLTESPRHGEKRKKSIAGEKEVDIRSGSIDVSLCLLCVSLSRLTTAFPTSP